MDSEETVVCIIGLGYVGLPLVKAFSKHIKAIGYDNNAEKMIQLGKKNDNPNLVLTSEPLEIGKADFIIICVPTPITKNKEPELSHVINVTRVIGNYMKKGSVVILESTVYPSVTEEIIVPILEKESGMKCGEGFQIGYSPERINPGDDEHSLDKITKVVAGMDEQTTELIVGLYSNITPNIYRAKDIKTAEAAKVIENIQRDLNIALMNELAIIFEKLGLNTKEVLDTAATKWNFQRYSPGLVGGHCIPVDPYYLVHKSRELGYQPQVILAGRTINDSMANYVAEMTIKALNSVSKVIKGAEVLIMGLTYKENVADTRETPVKDIIKGLREYGINISGYDPLLEDIEAEFGIEETEFIPNNHAFDAVIVTVGHDIIRKMTIEQIRSIMNDNPVLIDVRGLFSSKEAANQGIVYRSL